MKPELLNGKCPMLGCENANLWKIIRTARVVEDQNEYGDWYQVIENIYQCAECKNLYIKQL